MRVRLVLSLAAVIIVASAALASTASGATYCLYAGDCYGVSANVYPATSAGMNAAGQAAFANPGSDKIEIGSTPVEITSSVALNATPANQLSIEGVGGSASELHMTQSSGYGLGLNYGGEVASGSISNLRIKLEGPATGARLGLEMTGGRASSVEFDISSGPNEVETYGLRIDSGSECQYCTFYIRGNSTTGMHSMGSAKVIGTNFYDASGADDSTTGLLKTGTGTMEVSWTHFVELYNSIKVVRGTLDLHDATIDIGGHVGGHGVRVEAAGDTNYTLAALIDGVTIVGDGFSQRAVAVDVESTAVETASATIVNSLIFMNGASPSTVRCINTVGAGQNGVGSVLVSYTFTTSGTPSISGCTGGAGAGNVDSNSYAPIDLFVDWDNGDLRLAPDAPVIDKGDSGTTQGSRVDAFGADRFVDWTGTGTDTIDMGGSEYQNYVPGKPSRTASTTTVNLGFPVDFSAFSLDGNQDSLTYTWSFGDGESSTEQSPSHVFAAAGTYNVTVRASDGTSQSEESDPITITVVAGIPIGGGGGPRTGSDCCSAGAGLTKAKLSTKNAAKLKNGFAVSATKPKSGGFIPITTNGKMAIKLSFEKPKAGYVVGSQCKAKQGKTGSAKRCSLPVKGTQTVELPAGTSYLSFRGKWNKKTLPSGKYTLVGVNSTVPTNKITVTVTYTAKQGKSGKTK